MIKVTVAQGEARAISYTDKRTGQPAKFYTQVAYVHTVDRAGNPPLYPEKVELPLERDGAGQPLSWAPGEYELHPSSVYVDRNGRLAISPRLAPVSKKLGG